MSFFLTPASLYAAFPPLIHLGASPAGSLPSSQSTVPGTHSLAVLRQPPSSSAAEASNMLKTIHRLFMA